MIEKQQGMEVLGAFLSPSMSIKDYIVVGTSVEIECIPNHLAGWICLTDREAE
jgi:hypothetical protein